MLELIGKRIRSSRFWLVVAGALLVFCLALTGTAVAQSNDSAAPLPSVVVHPQFGGQILGFGIDQGGTEGLLSEYVAESGGQNLVASEVFDQSTGAILHVLSMRDHTMDDYVTEGVVGNHVGLELYQQSLSGGIHNYFYTINPLSTNRYTGLWTPTIQNGYQLWGITLTQGFPDLAVLQRSEEGSPYMYLYSANVAANTFGPLVSYNDPNIGCCPGFAYDTKLNVAMLAGSNGSPTTPPILATINLATGAVHETTGFGVGNVNGLAIDPLTDNAVFTTQGGPFVPPFVEFYNLRTQTMTALRLPGSDVGGDVEFDSLHRLFIVAAGDGRNNSILEYDTSGNLQQTITGGSLNSLLTCCQLNPSSRTGFGLGAELESLQAFSY